MDQKERPASPAEAGEAAADSQPPLELLPEAPAETAPRQSPAEIEIVRLESELEQAREGLARVEANRQRLAEQAKNLLLLDSLTLDNWSDAHQRLALEAKQADDDHQRRLADCRRLETQLQLARQTLAEPPVDLAA